MRQPRLVRAASTQIKQIAVRAEGMTMRKPLLSIDEPVPTKATRADGPPIGGFSTVISSRSLTRSRLLKPSVGN